MIEMAYIMTPELRAELRRGFEDERENWGSNVVDAYLRRLDAVPEGPIDSSRYDELDKRYNEEGQELTDHEYAEYDGHIINSILYFGLEHFAANPAGRE